MDWNERVATISINPDMATREDIARLAAEYMELRHKALRCVFTAKGLEEALGVDHVHKVEKG